MPYTIQAVCLCHRGKVRANNEDNFFFAGKLLPAQNDGLSAPLYYAGATDSPALFAVFDGMGGGQLGEIAAHLAAQTLRDAGDISAQNPTALLSELCQKANRRICGEMERQMVGRIGSTAVMAYVAEENLWLCNIGDSRAYLLREGMLRQFSEDHTEAAMMRRLGVTGRKPRLTQHLGIFPDEMLIEPYQTSLSIRPGDKLLLCSDGVTDLLTDRELENMLKTEAPVGELGAALLGRALELDGVDNTTLILCEIGGILPVKNNKP